MKIYVKASDSSDTPEKQEKRLCKFMRDNYGLSASINTNNNVCNLRLDRLACVVVSDKYNDITWENWAGEEPNTQVHTLGSLLVPYDTPLNEETANTIIGLLTFTEEEKKIRKENADNFSKLKAANKQISEGQYLTQLIKNKLGISPDDKFSGKPRFSENRINKYIYYNSAQRYNDIKSICEEVDSVIVDKWNSKWFKGNISCTVKDDNRVIVIIDDPFKLLIDPKTLEIVKVFA